jgi:hypothetical protein
MESEKDDDLLANVFGRVTLESILSDEDKLNELRKYYEEASREPIEKLKQKFIQESLQRSKTCLTLRFGTDGGTNWENVIIGDEVTDLSIYNDDLNKVCEVSDDNINKIRAKIINLKSIGFYRVQITSKVFEILSALSSLEKISTHEVTPVSEFFDHVHNFPELQTLYMYNSKLVHPNLQNLRNNTKLKNLDCHNCFLSDVDFMKFPPIHALEWLGLGYNDLTCTSFEFIKDMPNLKAIYVWGNTRFNIDGLKLLTKFSKETLTEIGVQDCPLIDDSCMKYFLSMKKIQEIALYNTTITENGLKQLRTVKTLRYLFLPDQISVEFAKKLQEEYMPKCHFSWKGGHKDSLSPLELPENYD